MDDDCAYGPVQCVYCRHESEIMIAVDQVKSDGDGGRLIRWTDQHCDAQCHEPTPHLFVGDYRISYGRMSQQEA